MSKEIAASRKGKRNQEHEQGKGKCKLIIVESLEDEEQLVATAYNIIEDDAANKISIETQFQRFVEVGALAGRPKKSKTTHMTTPENVVDLVSTPPPPSLTKITEEQVPAPQSVSPLDLCKRVMSEEVKEKFDKGRYLQELIEKLPEIFTSA